MLSQQDNELLTQTDQGTPMGELMRRFWLPAFLSEEVAERDGKPVRLRLLGENLVAFRDTEGRVGLLEEGCPHRCASLALAANEDNGLRCLYHGWKFTVAGTCVDTPTEPDGSKLHTKVRAVAYPTREAGGAVWAYLGPPELQPEFPEFEFLNMAEGHSAVFKVLEDCNYGQAVEGTIDSAHAGILHRESPWGQPAKFDHERDLCPKLEYENTLYGLRYAGTRQFRDEQRHARITQFMMPVFTLIPPDGVGVRKHRRMANAFVPRDDESTWHIQWFFDETQPIDIAYRIEEGGHWVDENYRKLLNIDNWYQQDRQMMKTTNMSGIRGILTQDHAVSESQGRILDRAKEHLGTSDIAVIAWRRLVLWAARELAANGGNPVALSPSIRWREIKAETIIFPNSSNWKEQSPLAEDVKLSLGKTA